MMNSPWLLLLSCHLLVALQCVFAFIVVVNHPSRPSLQQQQQQQMKQPRRTAAPLFMSDWSSFQALDDDEDLDIDTTDYAKEEDSQEAKAQVGASLEPPALLELEADVEPLFVPTGSQLELDEETVLQILAACREEIGTLFGYSAENRGVGITGGVDFVEMDGPTVVLSLKGRFWHERSTVLDRVASYLQTRIPEIIDVIVEDEWQLSDEANRM